MTTHQILAISIITLSSVAAHDHFAAGIEDTNSNGIPDAGEPLRMYGPDLSIRVFHLLPRPAGLQRYGGHYGLSDNVRTLEPNDVFSLTALSDGREESGEVNFAHSGAYIWTEIIAVAGPPGGRFGFWERGTPIDQEQPSVSLEANQPTGNPSMVVSGGIDAADQDPYGHIHGRAWTADRPGDYHVTFRFVDRSTTGPGGGPWHPPSAPFVFHFRAGPDFQPVVERAPEGSKLTWPSRMGIWEPYQTGITFTILRSSTTADDDWTSIGTVTGTTEETATFTDPSPPSGRAFYRLSYDWSAR